MRGWRAVLAAAALLGMASPAYALEPSPPPAAWASPAAALSPKELFSRAFERLESYPVPAYAAFVDLRKTTQSPGTFDARETQEIVRYAERMADGMQNASSIPTDGQLPQAEIGPHFLGPFAWSLRTVPLPQPRADATAPVAAPAAPPNGMQADLPVPLKTIAHVETFASPNYTVALAGEAESDGHRTYHLTLSPHDSPERHNLRDLWIDAATYDIWKAHFVGRYRPTTLAEESASDVTVYFKPIAQYWVLSRAVWTWNPVGATFLIDSTTISIAFPPDLPDWLFDEKAYERHREARDPDFLGPFLQPQSP